jgi:hypothetical protein
MHSATLVLLPRDTRDLWDAGANLLRPHRGEGRPFRLDYFTVGDGHIADSDSATAFGVADDVDLARNVCLVSRLRSDFLPGALVTPDGRWYEPEDHGWGFIDGDTPANRAAEATWVQQVRQLLATHADCVAVEFDTHC